MVSQSRSPTWDKKKMYVFSNIAEQEVEYVVFKIIHKDTITFKDIVIGVAPVELASAINSPNITQDAWHVLRKTAETSIDRALGELRVQITYMMEDIVADVEQEVDETIMKRRPNHLQLTLEKGRNLMIPAGQNSIDPDSSGGAPRGQETSSNALKIS